jgi:hypothetical protein
MFCRRFVAFAMHMGLVHTLLLLADTSESASIWEARSRWHLTGSKLTTIHEVPITHEAINN